MAKIILVRHGESQNNLEQTYPAHENIPLTNKGIEQAKKIAQGLKGTTFEKIYCSPLLRTKQTLEQIQQFHQNTPIIFDYRLREAERGIFNGRPGHEFKQAATDQNLLFWKYRPPKGEDYFDVAKRLQEFLNDANIAKETKENILIVAHDGSIRVLLSLLLSVNISTFANCSFINTSISEIEIKDDEILLNRINCCKHLE